MCLSSFLTGLDREILVCEIPPGQGAMANKEVKISDQTVEIVDDLKFLGTASRSRLSFKTYKVCN